MSSQEPEVNRAGQCNNGDKPDVHWLAFIPSGIISGFNSHESGLSVEVKNEQGDGPTPVSPTFADLSKSFQESGEE